MSLPPLKTIVQNALSKHTASIIFLHGLGDTGAGWQFITELFSRSLPHVKWVLPSARQQSVTANGGFVCPSWFDIHSFDANDKKEEDTEGILQAKSEIQALIDKEIEAGIPPERIVLGGFSQGGALALATGLTTPRKLAGLVVLSSWVPIRERLKMMTTAHASSHPIFMAHGTSDPVIKFTVGSGSADILVSDFGWKKVTSSEGNGLLFKAYKGMPHSASPEELADLQSWLQKIIPQDS